MKGYILKVYNPSTQKIEDVITTKEVYDTYRRMEWKEKYGDKMFYKNEIQFSSLNGLQDGLLPQYASSELNPAQACEAVELLNELEKAISKLDDYDQAMIKAIYIKGKTEREYSSEIGESQQTVHYNKLRILKNLKLFLEIFC